VDDVRKKIGIAAAWNSVEETPRLYGDAVCQAASQNKAVGWERQDWDDFIEELLTLVRQRSRLLTLESRYVDSAPATGHRR
jgi:hypothetical protein